MKDVVVFSAPWCAGCKVVEKQLSVLDICYTKVDITSKEGGEKAKALGIKSIPTAIIDRGELGVKSYIGSTPETIKDLLEDACG